jgi:hypothetical protein
MSDDALLDLVAFAKRLDQPEILVPTVGCLDGAKEQATPSETLHISRSKMSTTAKYFGTTFSARDNNQCS